MLTIRLKRTGRSGHAQYRLVAQDSRFSPSSGRVVAYLGSYDPHTKVATINGEKVSSYLSNGAQPSDRAAKLLKKEGIKLPEWVEVSADKQRKIRNPEKLRRNRPAEEAEAPKDESAETQEATDDAASEAPVETQEQPEAEAETTSEEPAREEPEAAEDAAK